MAAGRVSYTPPKRGAVAAILNGPGVRAALAAEAVRGKAFAESISAEFADTGDYASKFEVSEGRTLINGIERPTGVLANTSGHAAAVEWGYHGSAADPGSKAHRVLGRTAEFLGESGGTAE